MLYESQYMDKELPSPVAAIEFRMDQAGLTPRDLVPFMGSRAKVSEVLSGKRDITMSMARALHKHLGISADVLLREPGAAFDAAFDDIEPHRFPLKEMAKRKWIPGPPDLLGNAEELIRGLMERAGGRETATAGLYRKNDHRRINAKTDEYALRAWCWQVLATATAHPPDADYAPGTVTPDFLRRVAQLSSSEVGPRQARDFLAEHGIALEVVEHLPRTHLDGAALRLGDGRPVVGLTLRYDRIDNFWFCLLHELAHVGLHLDGGDDDAFVDDLTLRDLGGAGGDSKEAQADQWAEEALIPQSVWEASGVREAPTAMSVLNLAYEAAVPSGHCRRAGPPRDGQLPVALSVRRGRQRQAAVRLADRRQERMMAPTATCAAGTSASGGSRRTPGSRTWRWWRWSRRAMGVGSLN